jgi:hypothetical protein
MPSILTLTPILTRHNRNTLEVLSQYDAQGILHPMAYFSKQYTPVEAKYDIYNQELGAIVKSLDQWRPECK